MPAIRKGPLSITKVTRQHAHLGEVIAICYRAPCLSSNLSRRRPRNKFTKKVSTINLPSVK